MTDALRHVTIVRDDDVYEAFPDICQLPTGKLLCIYRESDVHRASTSRMILMESEDRGRTWTNKRPFDTRRSFAQNRSTWNAPRIRVLPDGRLVANFDAFLFPDEADDWNWPQHRLCFRTFLWFSDDEGRTWSERRSTEIEGACSDKLRVLTDDHWLMAIGYWSVRFPGAMRVNAAHPSGGRTTAGASAQRWCRARHAGERGTFCFDGGSDALRRSARPCSAPWWPNRTECSTTSHPWCR